MSVIEMNTLLVSKKGLKETEVRLLPQEVLTEFVECVNINDTIQSDFEVTNNHNSFFANYNNILKIVGKEYASDCFYAVKLGSYFKGVPNKVAYFLEQALQAYENTFVNSAFGCVYSILKPYEDKLFCSEAGQFTIKDIAENIIGRAVDLITIDIPKVKAGNFYEIWVPTEKRVAIVPEDIGNTLSYENIEQLTFSTDKGICIGDTPIRTLNGRFGITSHDFDLRECI